MIPLIIVITGRKLLIITVEAQKVNICCNSVSFSFFELQLTQVLEKSETYL